MTTGFRHRLQTTLLTVAIGMLSGCVAPAARRPISTAAVDEAPADARTAALAAQAQRDVEHMRLAGQPSAPANPAAPRPEIQWIVPGDAEHPGARAGGDEAQQPLASAGLLPDAPPLETPPAPVAGRDEPRKPAEPTADAVESQRMQQLIVDLSGELYRQGARSDMPMRQLLAMAAMGIVTPDRPFVPDALPGLTDRERELLGRMHDYFVQMGRELAESGDPEAVVRAAQELSKSLAREPRLGLPQAALCTRVGGFGDYDEFPRNQAGHYTFLAQSGQQAVIYVEIEDFTSELNEKAEWVTELSQQLVIYSDRDGIPVWREDWQAGVDASKNQRDDFFIVQVITIPKRLSVGRYQLKIRIRDEKSGAESETVLDFEMVADPRMTGN